MEEAMVLHSLYRENGLMQIEIAALLSRHKSWVCRRICLIEQLDDEVKESIKLGLVKVSVGWKLARLQRCNQEAVLSAIQKHRLTVRQTEGLISSLLYTCLGILSSNMSWAYGFYEFDKMELEGCKLIAVKGICTGYLWPHDASGRGLNLFKGRVTFLRDGAIIWEGGSTRGDAKPIKVDSRLVDTSQLPRYDKNGNPWEEFGFNDVYSLIAATTQTISRIERSRCLGS